MSAARAGARRQAAIAARHEDPGRHARRERRGRADARAAHDRPHVPVQPAGGPRHAVRVPRAAAAGLLDAQHLHPAVDRVHRRRRPHPQHRGHGAAATSRATRRAGPRSTRSRCARAGSPSATSGPARGSPACRRRRSADGVPAPACAMPAAWATTPMPRVARCPEVAPQRRRPSPRCTRQPRAD